MMRRLASVLVIGLLAIGVGHSSSPQWAMNATIIEACSCPMFCQCYFNTSPAGHHEHGSQNHYCRFNMAYKVNKGNYGSVKLDGAKFWISGDLGGDWSEGNMDWAVVTFDKSLSNEQRQALTEIVPHIYPAKWSSFSTGEGVVDNWKYDNDSAHATLDGGKSAEIKLKRFPGMTDEPIAIHNLRYWGVQRHEGFVLMPNEVEAWRKGDKAFEYRGTNGFMITLDINSSDVAAKSSM